MIHPSPDISISVKKMKPTYLLSVISLIMATGLSARDFNYNGVSYTVLDENAKTCETSPTNGTAQPNKGVSGDLVLPSHPMDGNTEYTLVSIGLCSFGGTAITSVTIPATVTSIGNQAFNSTGLLTSIDIPNAVKTIGDNAFQNCKNLARINLGESVESIGYSAFYHCDALENIEFPASLKHIGEYAFSDCVGLKNVAIGKSVETLGKFAFFNCVNLESVVIPGSVKQVENQTFNWCKKLRRVTYEAETPRAGDQYCFTPETYNEGILIVTPEAREAIKDVMPWKQFKNVFLTTDRETVEYFTDGVWYVLDNYKLTATIKSIQGTQPTRIGNVEFQGNTYQLTGDIPVVPPSTNLSHLEIAEGVATLPEGFCKDNPNLQSVTFTTGIKEIPANAFSGCEKLTDITLAVGIETIGKSAFDGARLSELTIPATVTDIAPHAFTFAGVDAEMTILGSSTPLVISDKAFVGLYHRINITSERISAPRVEPLSFYSFSIVNVTVPVNTMDKYRDNNWVWYDLYSDSQPVDGVMYRLHMHSQSCTSSVKAYVADEVTIRHISQMGINFYLDQPYNTPIIPLGDAQVSKLTFGDGCITVPADFAKGNTSLQSVTFGTTVTTISNSAFEGASLHHILFLAPPISAPASDESQIQDASASSLAIGELAFANPATESPLREVVSEWHLPPAMPENAFSIQQYHSAKLTVPRLSTNQYQIAEGWQRFYDAPQSAIDDPAADITPSLHDTEIYTIQGVKIGCPAHNLPAGIYILRQGSPSRKLLIP